MLKKHSQLFEGLFTASDLVVVTVAWLLSYWIRFQSHLVPVEKGVPPLTDYLRMLVFLWPIWAFVFRRFRLYRPMRGANRLREILLVVRANSLSVLLFLAVAYLFLEKSVPTSRLVFLIFWGLSSVLLVLSRSGIRSFLRLLRRRGYNLRYILIVGSGSLAANVARRMLAHPEYGSELVGCLSRHPVSYPVGVNRGVDSNRPAIHRPTMHRPTMHRQSSALAAPVLQADIEEVLNIPGVDVIGAYADLPRILEQGGIDQVVIALPLSDHEQMTSVIASIGDSMVDIKVVPDLHQFIQLGSQIEDFDGLPVVSLASTPLCGINRILKRGLDFLLGTVLFLGCLPLMLLLALLVKLTSRGPILFTQERVGLDGQRFRIYKFRTMYLDAEVDGARFAVRGDPRVTPLGRLMRKTSLDELPQLLNVIQGDMSLVGPRPERPVFIQEFRKHFPRYMLRHKVQAGMTGWAQVNGWRGNTSIERRIEHDLYYIEHWSLSLDLKILGLTLINSFRDRNAY